MSIPNKSVYTGVYQESWDATTIMADIKYLFFGSEPCAKKESQWVQLGSGRLRIKIRSVKRIKIKSVFNLTISLPCPIRFLLVPWTSTHDVFYRLNTKKEKERARETFFFNVKFVKFI